MAQRSSSKNFRKSTNDLFDSGNDSRFKSMYAQAFVDHSKKDSGVPLPPTVSSPANRLNDRVSGKVGTPAKQNMTIDMRSPQAAFAQMSADNGKR